MTPLSSARKRAEEFDALVNGVPSQRPELAELATVVTVLRAHAPVSPRPEFAASLREQLMTEAATVLTGEAKTLALPTRRRGTRERRLVAAATAAVFIGGTAGMAVASQNALPGDALYPIKRTIERAEARLNTNDAGKGNDLLGQADHRLTEVTGLLEENATSPRVSATIDDFSEAAAQGAALLVGSFEADRKPEAIESIREFAAESLTVLQELAKTAPPEAQESLADAAQLLQDLDDQAMSLCAACADDLPPLEIKELLLTSTEVKRALEAAAGLDKNASATGGSSTPKPEKPTKSDAPAAEDPTKADGPKSPLPDPGATVDDTKKDIKKTVDDTVAPLQDLVDELLPGVGELLGDITDPVLGGLLGP